HRVLHEGLAGNAAAQAEVDDVGRGLVVRHAGHAAAGRPDDGVADVGPGTAQVAQHADVLDLGAMRHAGHAEVVVGQGRDRAGHVGAVPAAVVLVVPVTLVRRVRVTAIAVTGVRRVGDEVIAGDELALQVLVFDLAGVQHRDHEAFAVDAVPGFGGVDAHAVAAVVPLLREQRVVRLEQAVGVAVGLDGADGRVLHQRDLERLALDHVDLAVEADQFGARAQGALDVDAGPELPADGVELAAQVGVRLAALVEADDEFLVVRVGGGLQVGAIGLGRLAEDRLLDGGLRRGGGLA